MQPQNDSNPLLVRLFVVRRAEDRVGGAIGAYRRLHNVWDEPLAGHVVVVLELLARVLRVPPQVVVGAVMDPLELLPAEGEEELDVRRRGGVMRPLVLGVLAEMQPVGGDAQRAVPPHPLLFPLLEEPWRVIRTAEVLHLHLLELT